MKNTATLDEAIDKASPLPHEQQGMLKVFGGLLAFDAAVVASAYQRLYRDTLFV